MLEDAITAAERSPDGAYQAIYAQIARVELALVAERPDRARAAWTRANEMFVALEDPEVVAASSAALASDLLSALEAS